ncbi:MAG TPA: universal stress protein, partial [Bacteroidia bacterium]|nr:universal stress protein [Bacteroidia bacterium]
ASKLQAEVILYHIVSRNAEGDGPVPSAELKKVTESLELKARDIAKEFRVKCTPLIGHSHHSSRIMSDAEQHHADLIIMGITPAPRLEKTILGSKTQELIRTGKIPVMAIPEQMQFNTIRKIELAVGTHIPDYGFLQKLCRFAEAFHAHIEVVHIHHGSAKVSSPYMETSDLIKHTGYKKISCTVIQGEGIALQLDKHIKATQASLLVIIRKHLGVMQDLFSGIASQMTYTSEIPLLIFNEEEFNLGPLGVKEEEILG